MKIVDSSVWIDHFQGKTKRETTLLAHLLATEPLAIGDLILAEVLQGFSSDKDFEVAKKYMSVLPCFSMVNPANALKSAENYRLLRKKGITIRKTIDILIATFCIENDHELLHRDRDFDHLQKHLNLKVL